MRVEQRIGRVHRLGQTNDVKIYNLSTQGTIEEHILNLLHEKINMFEAVIGELDTILERIEKANSLESSLFKLAMEAKSDDDLRHRIGQLGDTFHSARQEIEEKSKKNEHLHGLLHRIGKPLSPANNKRTT